MLRRTCLALVLTGGCAGSSTTPPTEPATPEASTVEAQTVEASEPATTDEPETELGPADELPPEQRAILDRINDRYAEETNPQQWGDRFEREGREVHDRQAEVLAELGIAEGTTVADIGAGTGLFTLPFAEAVGPSGKVYAVDIQTYFLDHIRERAKKAGLEQIEVVAATAESAELPAGKVDLVFMCDAYHHVEQPGAYLRSLRRAMAEGGRLVIIDYEKGEKGSWHYDHIRATPEQFRAEFEGAGFVLEREVKLLEDNFFFVFRAG